MDMTVKIMRQFEKEFEESHAVFFVSADTHKMHTENVKCQVDAGFNSLRFKTFSQGLQRALAVTLSLVPQLRCQAEMPPGQGSPTQLWNEQP